MEGGRGGGQAEGEQPTAHAEEEESPGPVGLRTLCAACARLYPDQPNPLQVTARVKYWLGGPDPLDYISMYWNPGRVDINVNPHWHYISLGVSDLHGDGRVHAPPDRVLAPADAPSGFGLELTFRLAAPASLPPAPPPVWPAALLQSLARYIFTSGVRLCVGDHISWHASLDGSEGSRIRHMLVAEDPQLRTVRGPLGTVQFVQLVGVTSRELRAAQRGAGTQVLRALAADAACGGAWLVTDVSRRASCSALRARASCAHHPPADLAGVSTHLRWAEWTPHDSISEEEDSPRAADSLSLTVQEEIRSLLQLGLHKMNGDRRGGGECERDEGAGATERQDVNMSTESAKPAVACHLSTDSLKQIFTGGGGGAKEMSMSSESFEMGEVVRALEAESGGGGGGGGGARALAGVHVVLNAEGGSLLPLALQGRVLHSRHFTWRCASGARAVTFVAEGVSGALVSPRRPYVATAHGWLQVLIPSWLARDMASQAAQLEQALRSDSEGEGEGVEEEEEAGGGAAEGEALPLVLCYPRVALKLTVLHPDTPLY